MSQPRVNVGATPGKLALVGVLAVVMVIVIASNWPSAAAPPDADATLAAEPPGPGVVATSAVTTNLQEPVPVGPFGEFAEDHHWPELSMKEVTAIDPLAVSAWAVPLAAASEQSLDEQEQVEALISGENAIILVSGDKRIARIGDREYQVGDVVGHLQISEISAKGVVLSEAP